ncbi:MFS transporter, partial [Dickeya dianthicola]
IPLVRLPSMKPAPGKPEHPLQALAGGVRFVCAHPVVGCVVLLGMLVSVVGAMRVLFPALAGDAYHAGPSAVGLMYSAVPLGAMLGAFTSGWVSGVPRPGRILLGCATGAFLAVGSLGLFSQLLPALLALVCYGYFNAITSLLQFTLIQSHTPDHLLGRVNSLGTAQDVTGDSVGALILGLMGKLLAPASSILAFGTAAALLGGAVALLVRPLRQCRFGEPSPDEEKTGDAIQEG